MTTPAPIRMAQGLDVLVPQADRAYPVPCEEWKFLKHKVARLSERPWVLQFVGSLMLGAGVSTLTTILIGGITTQGHPHALAVAWAITGIALTAGLLCISFSRKEQKHMSVQAGDIVHHMELIERRYDTGTA